MQPGDVVTLTVGDGYYAEAFSIINWPLDAGTPVYAQVDSWNPDTSYGAVLEIHEKLGEAYNNIGSTVSTTGGTAAPPAPSGGRPVRYESLPPRQ